MPTSPASDEPPDGAQRVTSEAVEARAGSGAATSEVDELEALREQLAHTQDRYRRALADLDNYRKRTQREIDRRVDESRQALLLDWLAAVDSVERALRLTPDDAGLIAVLEQMDAILLREGVTRLDAVGTRFDPERHEAIAVHPAPDAPDQTVLEVARSGFGLGDERVLRPAQVVVSRRPAPAS